MSPNTDAGMRTKLLADLDNRLDLFVGGDHSALTGNTAAALVGALAACADDNLETMYSLGLFHHYRLIGAVPGPPGTIPAEDAASALGYFAEVFRQAPDLLPDEVSDVVKDGWTPCAKDVETWRVRVARLLQDPRHYDQPECQHFVKIDPLPNFEN